VTEAVELGAAFRVAEDLIRLGGLFEAFLGVLALRSTPSTS